VTELISITCYG